MSNSRNHKTGVENVAPKKKNKKGSDVGERWGGNWTHPPRKEPSICSGGERTNVVGGPFFQLNHNLGGGNVSKEAGEGGVLVTNFL